VLEKNGYWAVYEKEKHFWLKCRTHFSISVRHGDAGDAVASPTLKNWPLFGQSIQLHSHVMR